MIQTRRTWLGTLLGAPAAGTLLVTATSATPAAAQSSPTAPVTGTLFGGAGAVAGTFALTRFVAQGGQLAAVGTFTGTVTNAAGAVTSGTQQITLPAQATGSCTILHLELGPLDLNLLGLMVHLDRVVLDITAQQGPGNLLGNLLCAIAHLLDSNASANALAAVLNQLLRALG